MVLDKDAVLGAMNGAIQAGIPHSAALGMCAVDCGPGWAAVRLPYREELVGNPDTGVLHGGVVTSLIDQAMGLSVFMKLPVPTRIATLDLRIDYLSSAAPRRDLLCRADCYKLTKQVAFVRALAYQEDPESPIASASAAFMVFDEGRSPMAARAKP